VLLGQWLFVSPLACRPAVLLPPPTCTAAGMIGLDIFVAWEQVVWSDRVWSRDDLLGHKKVSGCPFWPTQGWCKAGGTQEGEVRSPHSCWGTTGERRVLRKCRPNASQCLKLWATRQQLCVRTWLPDASGCRMQQVVSIRRDFPSLLGLQIESVHQKLFEAYPGVLPPKQVLPCLGNTASGLYLFHSAPAKPQRSCAWLAECSSVAPLPCPV